MSRNRKKKRKVIGSIQGGNLVVIAGLPLKTLDWVKRTLERDTSRKPARYVGVPSPPSDWRGLYKRKNIAEMLKLIERKILCFMPHRIIVLYVPSRDAGDLISALDSVCFLAPLIPEDNDHASDGNVIGWRNEKPSVGNIVYRTLGYAWKETDVLKTEITDKRISPFTLPAHNFYYPDSRSTISSMYHQFAQRSFSIGDLKDQLLPSRFNRDQLPNKAFKGQQYTDEFFQDCQGRVFPPDLYHAPSRVNDENTLANRLSIVLRQRYRFGVTVRDGNLHYDVQYKQPRSLRREPMYCAEMGDVLVTGSHANIGVNDVIWVPDGKKEPHKTK